MKRFIAFALAVVCLFSLAGCSSKEPTTTTLSAGDTSEEPTAIAASDSDTSKETATQSIDVDLSALSSTMVYAEVFNMLTTPDDYLGKTVKMKGNFAVYEGPDKNYYACLIADATACCSQGIEFTLEEARTYPDDYPELNSEITVTGTFDTYREGEYLYCQLINATLE